MAQRAIFFLTVCVIVAGTAFRLFLGVDFTDESHYLAMSVKFLRGQLPFVDEISLHQTSSLLAAPFIQPYFSRFGLEGIVLYGRALFFLLNLLVSAAVFFTLRRFGSASSAFLTSLAVLAFFPLNIPSLSYNSFGSAFLTLGIVSLLASIPLAAGFWLALCILCYPPFFFPAVFSVALWAWWTRVRYWSTGLQLFGGALPVLLLGWHWLVKGAGGFKDMVVYAMTVFDYGGGIWKVGLVLWHTFFANLALGVWLIIVCAGIIVASGRLSRKLARPFWLALPFAIFLSFATYHFTGTWFFIYFSFCAPVFLWLLPPSEKRSELFWVAWIPSFFAGLVAAWASSSSAASAVVGLLPAMIVAIFYWTEYAGIRHPARALPALLLLIGQYYGTAFYRDGTVRELTEKIPSGPFAGLYTTPRKAKFLTELSGDLKRWENNRGRILFYEFPAGYLMTSMPSAGRTSWIRTVSKNKEFYVDYHRAGVKPDDIVVTLKKIEIGILLPIPYPSDDELVEYLKSTHQIVRETENYIFWKPKPVANSLAGARTGS